MASCLFATDIKQEPHHTFSFAWGCSLRRSLLILVFTLLLSLFIALVWENSELLWTCLVQTDCLNPEVLKALLANSCQCPLLSLSCQLVYQSWRALKDYRFWNIVTWIVALSEFHQHCTLHFGLSIRWLRLVIWLSGAWVRKLHISTSNTWHLTSDIQQTSHPTFKTSRNSCDILHLASLIPSDIFDIHTWMENKSGKQSRTILIYFGAVK